MGNTSSNQFLPKCEQHTAPFFGRIPEQDRSPGGKQSSLTDPKSDEINIFESMDLTRMKLWAWNKAMC